MKYGVAGQLIWVRAFNESGYVEDDEDNITCDLLIDGGSPIALGNPTQATQKHGAYYYTLTAPQATGHELKPIAQSATSGVQVLATPEVIYTTREAEIKAKTDLITAGGFTVQRLSGRTINLFVFETYDYTLSTEDYTAKTINIAFEYNDTDVAAIADGDITKTSNSITFAIPAAVTSSAPRKLQYSIRDTANGNEVLVYGEVHVRSAAKDD